MIGNRKKILDTGFWILDIPASPFPGIQYPASSIQHPVSGINTN
jgi:hypothetical protein